jgi:hypothetical protein
MKYLEKKLEEIDGGAVSIICLVGAGCSCDIGRRHRGYSRSYKISKYYRKIRCSESDQITQQCCFRGSF